LCGNLKGQKVISRVKQTPCMFIDSLWNCNKTCKHCIYIFIEKCHTACISVYRLVVHDSWFCPRTKISQNQAIACQ
jgi:hypothetical protein